MVDWLWTRFSQGRRLAIILAVLLVGCSDDGYRPAHERVESEVRCEHAIEALVPPVVDDDDLLHGSVVHGASGGFIALPDPDQELQLGRYAPEGSGYEGYRFSKFGLIVRRDRQVSLEVVDAADDALLTFGGSGELAPSHALQVGPCPAVSSVSGEWVIFAGGVWVSAPGCVELVASHGGKTVRVRLSVGAACHEAS